MKSHPRSLTSLELFFDSRDWLNRLGGFFSMSLMNSLWAFCGFSSLVSLSIIWASKSCRSGGRLSSSDGSLRLSGRTIASGFEPTNDDEKLSVLKIVSSPVVSRLSSAISSEVKGTAGIISAIECHSRSTRRMFPHVCFLFCDANYEQFRPEFRLN